MTSHLPEFPGLDGCDESEKIRYVAKVLVSGAWTDLVCHLNAHVYVNGVINMVDIAHLGHIHTQVMGPYGRDDHSPTDKSFTRLNKILEGCSTSFQK